MSFLKIKNGVILRKRDCEFKQDIDILARKKNTEVFSLNNNSFNFLKHCNGINRFNKIKDIYHDIFKEEKSKITIDKIINEFNEILDDSISKIPVNKNQVVEINGLECSCRTAMWHLTNMCNLNCKHCYYVDNKEIKNSFNTKQIKVIVDNLSSIGVEKVNITGGEPLLLKKELRYLCDLLNKKCLFFSINTNAFEKIDVLLEIFKNNEYAESIQISLDGNKDIHEKFRGQIGSYSKICKHIKQLSDAGIKTRIVSMITKDWIGKEKNILETIKSLGSKKWLLEIPTKVGRWEKNSDKEINKTQLIKICDKFINLLKKEEEYFEKFTINQIYDWPQSQFFIKKKLTDPVCFHDLGLLSFGPEGISLCGPFRKKLPLYKFAPADIKDIKNSWNLIARTRINHKIGDNKCCQNCKLFDYCQGGCPGQYSDSMNFRGCDEQSKFLASIKKTLVEKYDK